MQLTPLQMEEILFTLCGGSVHTHQTEIAQGYVTLENGCRAGLGGRFLQNPEQGTVLQELTSVNLRIAREKTVPLPQELTAALRGHFIGMLLVGEPGSGKTTIGRAIMRILPTSGGEVLYKGQKINGKISRQLDQQVIKEIQMIFQDPQSSLNERAKVSYIVGEGLQNVRPDLTAAQREEKVRQALLDVGLLPEFASRFPHEFSGGQRQRIGIARALIVEPEFIIADEPISALDMSIRAQVLNLLRHLQKERGITYLFIAHDLSMVKYISDRIGVLHLGYLLETGTTEEIFSHPVHPYTRSLISAIPNPNPVVERSRIALHYDYKTSGLDYGAGTMHQIEGTHFVRGTDADLEKWV